MLEQIHYAFHISLQYLLYLTESESIFCVCSYIISIKHHLISPLNVYHRFFYMYVFLQYHFC